MRPQRFAAIAISCIIKIGEQRKIVHAKQHPYSHVYADGKFADVAECPRTVQDPVSGQQVCGLCGSSELDQGYGLGTGYGIGVYQYCLECDHFLDFVEDKEE